MTEFFLETVAIAAFIGTAMFVAAASARDSLHPAMVLGPMLLFLYVGMPLYLYLNDGFFGFLTEGQLAFAQLVNVVGVLALLAGVLAGARGGAFVAGPRVWGVDGARLARAGTLVGILGVVGFVWGIFAVGGFQAAYGVSYGGGWSESGYVRELFLLTIPAILMLLASGKVKRPGMARYWLALFALPLLVHGALGARRGPLFVVLVTVAAGLYLVRNERPRAWLVLAGGAALGVVLLLMVANRDKIYIGSDFDLNVSPTAYMGPGGGNEFIYGSGTVVAVAERNLFTWGGRYATVFFVRPIPRALWPDKYTWAADFFGINVETNFGIDVDVIEDVLGWKGAVGAAPGIVADLWFEFSWGMCIALFAIGFMYGRVWRRCVTTGGVSVVTYGALLCLSLYLVMQTLEAMAFRFLFMAIPTWFAWRWARRRPAAASSVETTLAPATTR